MRSWPAWDRCGNGWGSWPRSTRGSPRSSTRATRSSRSWKTSSSFLRGYAASIDASPERLQEVEDRLAALERLIRKHGPTLADVIEKRRALRAEQSTLESLGDRLTVGGGRRRRGRRDAYLAKARELSALRQSAAARFARALVGQLKELAMEHTRFEVRFAAEPARRSAVDRSRHRRRRVLRVSRTPARTSARSRASSRAGRCPVSCWR